MSQSFFGQHPRVEDEDPYLNQYNLLLQAPVAIAVFRGQDFIIEMANDLMLQIWGKTKDETWNKSLFDAHPGLREQGFETLMQEVMNTGKGKVIPEIPVMLNRSGAEEQVFLKLVYEPLRDKQNLVTGVMVMAHDITDLVQSKFEIKQSEQQFHDVFMDSPIAMAVLRGRDFVIESVNRRMLDNFWGKKINEVIGRSLIEVFPELEGQKYPKLLEEVLSTGQPHREDESIAMIKDGDQMKKFFIDFEYRPLFDREGLANGVMVTAYDTTKSVLYRQQLEEGEERSRLAIEATNMGTFEWDLRTQEFKYSQRSAEIFGAADKGGLQHTDLINLIHPDDLQTRNIAVAKAFSTGSLFYEVRLIWPDNTLHWVSIFGKISYDHNHVPVKMYGTALDTSREKSYQRALEESEEKFRSLANFLPTFIWTTDSEGNLTYLNKSFVDFSGMTIPEIMHGGWFQMLHPDDRLNSLESFQKAITSGTDFQAEVRFKKADGEYRWQLGRLVALKGDDDRIQMWIGTAVDIHDQKMMAEELEKRVTIRTAELKQANEELIRTNQELEQFAYVSSHDLQEPLRKIQTFSDLVLKRVSNESGDVRIHLDKIIASANRMSVLINDLLNYSRVSKADEKFVPINLNDLFETILSDFEVLISQKQALVSAASLPEIKGIPIQINQLFYNLVSNALKFSAEKPVITISASEVSGEMLPSGIPLPDDKPFIKLIFQDNGIGFDQVYASQIFTIFQRLNNRSQYSGTGIGLAICKKIVENHHGFIFATSKVNEGAAFTVYIPK